jgi:transposase InsO family protein
MTIRLHKNARTTPAIRRELQNSNLPIKVLARKYGLSRDTVRKWKRRDGIEDGSHRPHNLRATLTPEQEHIVVELRKALLLSLDDLLVITREFIQPKVSRSGLDRCLRRHGVASLKELLPRDDKETGPTKTFKDYAPGFVHIDVKYLPQMPDESKRRYLFVAIDRASRWVYLEILPNKSSRSATGFLRRLIQKAPFRISRILTDNAKEFTDRFCAGGERKPSGDHPFDQVCRTHGIEHRLIRPRHPQTNGMVERFNGRIEEVLCTTRFRTSHDLEATLNRYVRLYNHQIPQKALGHCTPVYALKEWQLRKPEIFVKKVYNLTGHDI